MVETAAMDKSGGVGPSPHYLGDDPLIEAPDFTAHMLAGMPGIIFLYDSVTGKSLYQNRSLSGLLGYAKDEQREMAGREWRTLMHPEDIVRFAGHRDVLRSLKPGEQVTFEYRVRDAHGRYRWLLGRDAGYEGPGARPGLIIGNAVDIDAKKQAEQRLDLLIHEFGHRVNNLHMMVMAIVSSTYRAGGEDFLDKVGGRLRALVQGNAALLGDEGAATDLETMVRATFAPHAPGARLAVSGPKTTIAAAAASNLSLALNELATNAVKYGALSTPDGLVAISWARDGDRLSLRWCETGGPHVGPPTRKGFGSRLLTECLASSDGKIAFDWPGTGLIALLSLPASAIAEG
jgi:PAS domain S-box-containing protein